MTKNMGSIDRIIRLSAAIIIALLIGTQVLTSTAAIILGILAVVFVLTSAVSFCPLYVPFKFSTKKKN